MKIQSIVKEQQRPLIKKYLSDPTAAWITDIAVVEGQSLHDPFHTTVLINEELATPFPIGVHRALGGPHDAANPGDLLCAALASCFESTLRMIANHLGIVLGSTWVKASAEVDVRGTLLINKEVPVGFQRMSVDVQIQAPSVKQEMLDLLLQATERSCIVFQTINQGIPIEVNMQTKAM